MEIFYFVPLTKLKTAALTLCNIAAQTLLPKTGNLTKVLRIYQIKYYYGNRTNVLRNLPAA